MPANVLLETRVWHRRLWPKENAFNYRAFHLMLDMNKLHWQKSHWWLGINRRGLISFYDRDHGLRDGSSSLLWAKQLLQEYGILAVTNIYLVTMPRVLGYLFNPVSFWLCYDKDNDLIAVISEVNNTFGQTHTYVCSLGAGEKISKNTWLEGEKCFHVSPFMDVEGQYRFRFNVDVDDLSIAIHYICDNKLKLVTSMRCQYQTLKFKNIMVQFLIQPLMTLKVISLIHWQALKLWIKKIRYRRLPPQQIARHSRASGVKDIKG